MLSAVLQCASEAEHIQVKEECAEENDSEDKLSEFKHNKQTYLSLNFKRMLELPLLIK